MLIQVISLVISYLVGAIPSGYWYAKYLFGVDVTQNGSGNIGATNVARVLDSKMHFAVIWLFDMGKAYVVLHLLDQVMHIAFPWLVVSAGALLIGNGFSPFLSFQGGKGIATTCGILFALFPATGIYFVCLSIIGIHLVRRVDYTVLPAIFLISCEHVIRTGHLFTGDSLFFLFLVPFLLLRHQTNIKQFFKQVEHYEV